LSETEVLLERACQGDEEAFEAVFRAYYGRIFALAYRLLGSTQEADDVTQETFLRLSQRPPTVRQGQSLLGWLMRVATNLSYNVLRAERRRQTRETAWHLDRHSDPLYLADGADSGRAVRAVLAALPERQAQILLLRHNGFSYAEVAQVLGVAPGSVGTLLARAERAFRQLYEQLCQDKCCSKTVEVPHGVRES